MPEPRTVLPSAHVPVPIPARKSYVLGGVDFQVLFQVRPRYGALELMGRGSFGTVASARDSVTLRHVAIKRQLFTYASALDRLTAARELHALIRARDPAGGDGAGVLQLLDFFVSPPGPDFDALYLVTPMYDCSLSNVLKNGRAKPEARLTVAHVAFIGRGLMRALARMHCLGMVHRDVKPCNMFVDADCRMALGDLGMCCALGESPRKNYVTTRWYRAPEIFCGANYGPPVDVWAAGCVLVEMLNGEPLFMNIRSSGDAFDAFDAVAEIMRVTGRPDAAELAALPFRYHARHAPSLPARTTELAAHWVTNPSAMDLVMAMLRLDPARRITAEQALAHPFLSPRIAESPVPESSFFFPMGLGDLDHCDIGASEAAVRNAVLARLREEDKDR